MLSATIPKEFDVPIYDIYIANRKSAVLTVAIKLGIFDRIQNKGPVSAVELEKEYDLSRRGADSFLVALHSLGLLAREGANEVTQDWGTEKYKLTSMAQNFLVKEKPCYFGGLIALEWDGFITPKNLLDSMKTGKMQAYGEKDVWELHEEEAETAKTFTLAMHSISVRPAIGLAQTFNFSKHKCFLDIGGGSGVYCISVLETNAHMSAIVLDLKHVCEVASDLFKKHGLEHRTKCIAGNFFKDPYPTKFGDTPVDVVFYSQILHDWPVDKGSLFLKTAYNTLSEGGIVMVNEKLLTADRSSPSANAMVSIDMLFWTEGQQYTAEKLFQMLTEAGFKNPQVQPTYGYWSVVWATK